MPETFPLAYSDPFNVGITRPYLWLHLTGPNGKSGDVIGVVDSGADVTSLPLDYASLMGYGTNDLDVVPFTQAGGGGTAYQARRPSTATVVGLPEVTYEFEPLFIDGAAMILWGRADLFAQVGVGFDQASETFTLVLMD